MVQKPKRTRGSLQEVYSLTLYFSIFPYHYSSSGPSGWLAHWQRSSNVRVPSRILAYTFETKDLSSKSKLTSKYFLTPKMASPLTPPIHTICQECQAGLGRFSGETWLAG